MSTLRPSSALATVFVGFAVLFARAEITVDQLDAFDRDVRLTALAGTDRLSRAMLQRAARDEPTAGPPEGAALDLRLLDAVIAEVALAPGGSQLIENALRDGDAKLARGLERMLEILNLPATEARTTVRAWATDGFDADAGEILRSALARPDARAVVREYFLNTASDWTSAVARTSDWLTAQDRWCDRLIFNLSVATGFSLEAVAGWARDAATDPGARWSFMDQVGRLVIEGSAIGRRLSAESEDGNATLVGAVWRALLAQVAGDPGLLDDYRAALSDLPILREEVDALLRAVVPNQVDSGAALEPLARGILLEAIDDRSRAAAAVHSLVPLPTEDASPQNRNATQDRRVASLSEALATAITGPNADWRAWLWWYLTRPAEAVSATIRGHLSETLTGHPDLTRRMIKASPLFTQDHSFDHSVADRGGFGWTVTAAELAASAAAGMLDPVSLDRYGAAAAAALASDDRIWNAAVNGSREYPEGIVASLVRSSLAAHPQVGAAWAATCARNDAVLRAGFVEWFGRQQRVSSSQGEAWLHEVSAAAAEEALVGHVEFARFREAFGQFVRDPTGWPLVWRRLAIESYAIPGELRSLLASAVERDSGQMARVFGLAVSCRGPMTDALRARVRRALVAARIADIILDRAASGDPRAAEAVGPVWDSLLGPSGNVSAALRESMRQGATRTTWYVAAASALRAVLEANPKLWPTVAEAAAVQLGVETPVEAATVLAADAAAAGEFIRLALETSDVSGAWTAHLLDEVVYADRAPAIAEFIRSRSDLTSAWREAVLEFLTSDARGLVGLFAAYGGPQVLVDDNAVPLTTALSDALFGDRVFFEQLLAEPGNPWNEALRVAVEDHFGPGVGPKWMVASREQRDEVE